jgi:hypothetical protein
MVVFRKGSAFSSCLSSRSSFIAEEKVQTIASPADRNVHSCGVDTDAYAVGLQEPVTQETSEFSCTNADSSTGYYIMPVMTVTSYTIDSRQGGHCIASYRNPWGEMPELMT